MARCLETAVVIHYLLGRPRHSSEIGPQGLFFIQQNRVEEDSEKETEERELKNLDDFPLSGDRIHCYFYFHELKIKTKTGMHTAETSVFRFRPHR